MDILEEDPLPYDQVRVIYFGAHWGARYLRNSRRVPTPVGESCFICSETINEPDQGLVKAIARLDEHGTPQGIIRSVHAECDLLLVIGHQVGVCSCNGDNPTRDNARKAWAQARMEGLHP